MTIEEFINEIIRVFEKVGIENAKGEARMLACHVLSCDETYLFFHQNEEIDDKVLLASAALINERTKGRPIQYVIGKANFYGLDVAVDERVLIPRPETEGLVEAALKDIKENFKNQDPKVLDLCTGSGCIAMAVAANLPKAKVVAADLSPKAFMLARYNLRPYENVQVLRGDLFEALSSAPIKCFDYILTNPPYIPSAVIAKLQKEVKEYEPKMALDGGTDGLTIIEKILEIAPDFLAENGKIFMEIGDDQAQKCMEFAQKTAKWGEISIIKDLQCKERIFRASKI